MTCQRCATGNTDKQAIPGTTNCCLSFQTKTQQMWCCDTHSTYASTCYTHLHPSKEQENTRRSREGTLQHRKCHDVTYFDVTSCGAAIYLRNAILPTCYTYHLLGNIATVVRVHCVCIQVCEVKHKRARRYQPRHEETNTSLR